MQVEVDARSTIGVTERGGDLVLVLRRGSLPDADLRALRAVLAPVTGRIVRPAARK